VEPEPAPTAFFAGARKKAGSSSSSGYSQSYTVELLPVTSDSPSVAFFLGRNDTGCVWVITKAGKL